MTTLNKYKHDVANADIGITIYKREEKVMTKSEQLMALAADLTEEECQEVAQFLVKKANALIEEKAKKAWQKMIEGWKEYRAIYPDTAEFITIDDSDYDLEINLYKYMDHYLN